jgi:type I restriction enzyme R subunit
VQVVVEHFRENVQPLLLGHAKAMVVVGSRVEAVRWQLAIDKYIKANNYPLSIAGRADRKPRFETPRDHGQIPVNPGRS